MTRAAGALVAAAALAGCPSGEHGVKHDASPGSSAAGSSAGSAAPPAAGSSAAPAASAAPRHPGATTGDVTVRVEWVDVPVAARTSSGATACKTPRAPAVEPTATWGIPDAFVFVDGAPAQHAGPAHLVVATCAASPRVAVGASLEVASADEHPDALAVHAQQTIDHLGTQLGAAPRPLQLPYAGHTAALALDAAPDDALAWIVAAPAAAVTEANGQVLVHDVPAGKHHVTAWLPPRGGQPARTGEATVTAVAGELVDVTVPLTP